MWTSLWRVSVSFSFFLSFVQASLTVFSLFFFTTSTDDDIIDFGYLAAMIRLGRKYDFLRFKNKALKYLRQLFPRNLKEWLAVHNDNSLLTKIIEFIRRVPVPCHQLSL